MVTVIVKVLMVFMKASHSVFPAMVAANVNVQTPSRSKLSVLPNLIRLLAGGINPV